MNLHQYQEAASRTCNSLEGKKLDPGTLDNYHMIFGMETEVGELMDVFKRNLAYHKPIDWVNVSEELADILWYVVNFARLNNIDLEKAMQNNIDKLKIRYPDKFTADNALNRNLDEERKELEK